MPGAPAIFGRLNAEPEIEVQINVHPEELGDGDYEVVLIIEARATIGDETAFVAELEYAGLFELNSSIPEEYIGSILLVECRGSCSRSRATSSRRRPRKAACRRSCCSRSISTPSFRPRWSRAPATLEERALIRRARPDRRSFPGRPDGPRVPRRSPTRRAGGAAVPRRWRSAVSAAPDRSTSAARSNPGWRPPTSSR